MARIYDFALPYRISGVEDSVGIGDLQSAGLWEQVPAGLQASMQAGAGLFGVGAVVTQADLDALPDPVWTYIADKLGLQWHQA